MPVKSLNKLGRPVYTILVLGLIPGTNIQISFLAYLVILAFGVVVAMVIWARYKFLRSILRHQPNSLRLPLPASQLHLRGQ